MVFTTPKWAPDLAIEPPESITLADFMLDEKYGRRAFNESKPPFTCGLTGKEYSAVEVRDRVEKLARGISKELGWKPNEGTQWDKVMGIFSFNAIDFLTLSWAVHRLSGINSPANAAYSADELAYQLKSSGSTALVTCISLLPTALEAAAKSNIPKNRVYLLPLLGKDNTAAEKASGFKTIDHLIEKGASVESLEPLRLEKGQGARQAAFLCYSSGTSGLPKGVMISHRNVIANVLQIAAFETPYREYMTKKIGGLAYTDVGLGLLPMSHIYALVVICHAAAYRGDGTITLPKFEMNSYLSAIQNYKINTLYVVPPIIINMIKNQPVLDKFDLSSVRVLFTGAAPLGLETAEQLYEQYPSWFIRQGYGLTETATVVCSSSYDDIWFGSSGSLLPRVEAKVITPEGNEVTGYDQPGELVVRSPSVTLGYLNNDTATKESFQDGWVRTGDEVIVRLSPKGNEHIFIVDRIKELIKVKGMQVAPAELEAHILTHPAVADCAVIPVLDEAAGEVPKVYVVKAASVGLEDHDRVVMRDIQKHVEKHKARHKWLKGGVEFIDVIPKSPSGKILRRVLRDKDRAARKAQGPKL